jgi:glutathione synthase/RimK-type ligase-like ATP-grasp enzyme
VETVKKIGVLFGQENTFPGALVAKINSMEIDGISAEFVEVGGVEMAKPCPYAVIVDRISHDVPFYRSYLKNAALTGTVVINNPFWWSADDKFFNYALAEKLGVAVPRTVLLPSKMYPPMTNTASFRNLEFPLKWDEIFEYVGFPAFLKPHDGGGWRDVFHVHSPQDFFQAYDQTRDLVMTLQAAVNFNEYFRCYVVGREKVHVMAYDPRRPHAERYVQNPPEYAPGLLERVEKDALTLCRALGYDLNTVEFAVEDGVPYAIDFMNPAPDADVFSVGQGNFDWIVNAVAEFAVKKAQDNTHAPMQGLTWSGFLQGGSEMAGVSKGVKAKVKAEVKKVAAKKSTGAAKKAMERDEPLQVKMHAEDLKSQNAAALRAGVNKKMLPARKNP